jgi:hypothetical protein
MFTSLRRPSAEEMTSSSPSLPTQITEVCGLPSALMVASTAGFGSSSRRRTASFSETAIAADDLTCRAPGNGALWKVVVNDE